MKEASGPVSQWRISLPADAFARAFPFHIACDDRLAIVQVGHSMVRMAPDVQPGERLDALLAAVRPAGDLTTAFLGARRDGLVLLEHRASGIRLRGQFVRTYMPAGWVFLGSPWFASADAVEAAGLTLDDFAPHDSIADLLLVSQTQQIAIQDLTELAKRLEDQRAALTRTEQLYRAAIAAANSVAYQEDLRAGQFAYMGDGLTELTGLTAAEISPARLRELQDPEEAGPAEGGTARWKLVDGQVRRRSEYPFRTPGGETRWISDASVIVAARDGHPASAIGMLTDVTSRKAAERRLRESEEQARRLAIVAASTHSGVLILDPSRRIEWANEGLCQLIGFNLDELRGHLPREVFVRPDINAESLADAVTNLECGQSYQGEFVLSARDGRKITVTADLQTVSDDDGRLDGITVVATDVTPLKEYEARLAQILGELDAVLRVLPGAIVAFDGEGRLAYCNTGLERLLELRADELHGMELSEVDALLAARCGKHAQPVSFGALDEANGDVIQIVRPAPSTIARTARVTQGGGSGRWRVVYLRDITRETEVDRMKSEFLSRAAHELRTPMSSVHGFAELLISREFDTGTVKTIAQTIHRQSSLVVSMVNELLDLARIESGKGQDFVMEVQSLAPILRETIEGMLVPGDPRRVELVPAAGDQRRAAVDAAQLRQALINVLSNAFKYSRGQGAIRVWLPTRVAGDRREVGIRVQDEGIGMTAEQLAHVFDRFYRANPAGAIPGTGLGMTLVKEIIEAMHGTVEITSEVDRGTTVTLWLPVVAD